MVETRHVFRHRASKAASIGTGRDAIRCVIRDLSITGAAIEVEDSAGIPERFVLFVAKDKLELSCCIVWRRAYRIGVTFE